MRRLLAATDLSPRSDRAVRRAADLARHLGAELLLFYVVDDEQPASLMQAERTEAVALLHARAADLAPLLESPAPRVLVEAGDAFDAIIRASEAQAVDLIVLGAHRRNLLRNIFVGTTVERVMRHGSCPVLMVNCPPAGPYRRILAAADLTEDSARALRTAARLGLLDGVDLTVLHAFLAPGKGGRVLADAPRQAIADHVAAEAQKVQADLARLLAEIGLDPALPPRIMVEEGTPAPLIRNAVGRLRPDLVLMGTGQRGMLHQIFLGSVAAEVASELECDVLVVPPDRPRLSR